MIAAIHAAALGPHADVAVTFPDPMGHTEILGDSEVGKSTLIRAVCLALINEAEHGGPFPVEAIREGADKASAAITTARGTVVEASVTRRRSFTRHMGPADAAESVPSRDALLARLGPVGSRPLLTRLILAPMQWIPLLQEQLGRPLRDLILSVLPGEDIRDVVAAIMEARDAEFRETDPVDVKAASAALTAANSSAASAKGRLEAARSRSTAAAATVEAPSDEDLAEAKRLLEAARVWVAHTVAVDRHAGELRLREQLVARREDVRRRRKELGSRPAVPAAEIRTKTEQLDRVRPILADLRKASEKARAAVAVAEADVKKFAGHDETCPTCKQVWAAVKEAKAAATAKLEEARKALKAEDERLAKNEKSVGDLERELAELRKSEEAVRAWDQANRAIGDEPNVLPAAAAPTVPTVPAPDAEEAAWAKGILQAEAEANGARRRAEQEQATAGAELERAERAVQTTVAEAARVEVLVAACRQAPTEVARQRSEALGDMGPVTLRFPPKETRDTPEIEVLIDGRPWWLASDGRKVVADLCLRAALRRAAKLDALPIFVDRAQDWSKEWPEVPGPVVFLRTVPGMPLTVRPFVAQSEAA